MILVHLISYIGTPLFFISILSILVLKIIILGGYKICEMSRPVKRKKAFDVSGTG